MGTDRRERTRIDAIMAMNQYYEHALQQGTECNSSIPQRMQGVHDLLQQFPGGSLSEIKQQFLDEARTELNKDSTAAFASNNSLLKLTDSVRDALALAETDFMAIRESITLQIPAVSDGNNFGVDVQMHVIEQLKAMESQTTTSLHNLSDMHWSRAEAIGKLLGAKESSKEVSHSESKAQETKDGVAESKTVTADSQKQSSKDGRLVEDLLHYVAALDVTQYSKLTGHLRRLRMSYALAADLLEKNQEKLSNPRGNSSGGNTMYGGMGGF